MRTRNQDGFTLIELLIVVAIIGIIAAIAIPGLRRAQMSGNEASMIGSMRAINTSQQNYAQKCNGYAPTLSELRLGFLSPDLTSGVSVIKSGFVVTMAQSAAGTLIPTPPAGCTGPTTNYHASAIPVMFAVTGMRSFATSEEGTIYYTSTNTAPGDPIPPGSLPIQ